jgi:hypothetical protein
MTSGGVTASAEQDPCMVYINEKTDEASYTIEPEPECPPPDCDTSIGYVDENGATQEYRLGGCDTRPTYTHETKPPHTKPDHGSTTTVTAGLFSVKAFAFCGPDFLPEISITFGNRPDLNGQTGVLSFSTGGSVFLIFQSNQTVTIPYPDTTQNVNLIYSLGPETATASVTYPGDCRSTTTTGGGGTSSTSTTVQATSTTSGGGGSTSTSTTSTTINGVTTTVTSTTVNGSTTTSTTVRPVTPPITGPAEIFTFGAATTACRSEVPVIVINFQNTFPELAGRTGTLTFADVNGNVVGSQPLVYQPNTTVEVLYPGTRVNPDGSIADVPGWILQPNGLWVRDPSDEFLRAGINLTYTVNPTATAFVTYPPESATCNNPENLNPPPRTPGAPAGLPPTK